MTGKDLIIYILQNDLENDNVFENGCFIGFINENQAAVKFNVGVATIKTWYQYGMLDGVIIGNHIFFLANVTDPRKKDAQNAQ